MLDSKISEVVSALQDELVRQRKLGHFLRPEAVEVALLNIYKYICNPPPPQGWIMKLFGGGWIANATWGAKEGSGEAEM